mgnify:CR=1 FL=1|jgi:hypothetical protein
MSKIVLKNVRLSFPSLFTKEVFEGKEGKFAATLLIDKSDTAVKKQLDAAIAALVAEAKVKIPADKYCLKDGDEIEFDGYKGCWSLKASNAKRPTVIDRDKTPLTADDDKIYAGCYVNAIIDFWIQNNSYGKRVNANLYGIQFLKDGEPFGQGPVDVTEEFEDLDL